MGVGSQPTELHPHGSLVEQVHRVMTTDQGVDAWVIAEEIVKVVSERAAAAERERLLDTTGEADRIFCPDCGRAIFYQRLHVSTHGAECRGT